MALSPQVGDVVELNVGVVSSPTQGFYIVRAINGTLYTVSRPEDAHRQVIVKQTDLATVYHANAVNEQLPTDHGLITWAFDPAVGGGGLALAVAGTLYVTRLHLKTAQLVTNIEMFNQIAGNTLTAGQCFAAVFDATSGTQRGVTADQSGAWVSTGAKKMALTTPVTIPAGDVQVAVYFNGTTGPGFMRGNNSFAVNYGLAAAASRFSSADTGRTTSMPATLGALTGTSTCYWAGLS